MFCKSLLKYEKCDYLITTHCHHHNHHHRRCTKPSVLWFENKNKHHPQARLHVHDTISKKNNVLRQLIIQSRWLDISLNTNYTSIGGGGVMQIEWDGNKGWKYTAIQPKFGMTMDERNKTENETHEHEIWCAFSCSVIFFPRRSQKIYVCFYKSKLKFHNMVS